MEILGIEIKWLGHSGFLIKNSKIIYIDPFKISGDSEKADLICITHSHYDHCSLEDIHKIVKEGTRIIMPADCQSKINRFDIPMKIEIIDEGKEIDISGDGIKISAFPAYNINKLFHTREMGGLGYLIKMKEVMIYHSGDTDVIPEMQKLTGYHQEGKQFIALLPVGGRFTMSAEEAVEAAKIIKPNLAIPMHYGTIIGSEEDAKEFKDLCEEEGIKVEILKKD